MLMPCGFSLLARKKRPRKLEQENPDAEHDHHHQRAERGTRLSASF